MLQLFRYLRLMLTQAPAIHPTETWSLSFRVMPSDCDFNLHMNNVTYHAWLDVVRTDYARRLGAFKLFTKHGWASVLSSQSITYIREIKPFSRVDVSSRLIHFDNKYVYIEHNFYVGDTLHAKAIARVAFLKRRKVHTLNAFLHDRHSLLGLPEVVLPETDTPPNTVAAKIALLNAKRESR